MRLEIAMRRDGGCLRPDGDHAWSQFDHVKSEKTVIVNIHAARNPQHHKKLWALASRVADFCDEFDDARDAVEWVKLHVPSMRKAYHLADGELVVATRSISFASMDQVAFNEFYERAITLWSAKLKCDATTLTKEIAA